MKTTSRSLRSLPATLLACLFAGQPVWADDTEVLVGPGGLAWATPNVLFIMDTSGSMGDNIAGGRASATAPSRLSIVQGVFEDLMHDNSGINVGLMRFDHGGSGGYFVAPMQPLNSSTRPAIITASNELTDGGNTPLAETLYEAARYYRGMSVDFGTDSVSGVRDPDNTSNYLSPVTSQCQANYVILLTDGNPNGDNGADNSPRIPDLPGYSSGSCAYRSDDCLDEVADYLHTVDVSDIPGTQTVDTYTIGFTTSQTLLQDTATAGGGRYITANNADELSTAFADILATITGTNDSFSPPAMAANSFSGVSHFNKLYYALFEPAATPKWDGNIKPYTLAGDPPQLTDAAGAVAVDSRGYFRDTSRSLWSDTVDGAHIADGGANGRLPAAADRNLYTYTGAYSSSGVPDTPALTADSNALKVVATSDLAPDMLGLSNPDAAALTTEFNSVIDTVRGYNLGAPLHSQPVLVTYGGTEDAPTMTLFTATNDGFLHALDAATGIEQFAFIPRELLPNLPTLTRGTGTHPYGLDGDITAWVKDVNHDHIITRSEGDHVYLYVGMRRGGNNYYALDVTDVSTPTLKWVILGGAGGNANFTELGQTWSRPTVTQIPYGAGSKTVLIFGGGYDTAQDANPHNADDSIGRAIYIVDAETGQRLWWAGPDGCSDCFEISDGSNNLLTNSIPSEVSTFDSNQDGNTDRLYVGDMRGQVFRVDLQATTTGVTASGVRLANLGGTTEADNRRFYYPPDVVFTQRSGSPAYLSVNIGSGYRAHPLNPVDASGTALPRVNDRFYSLRDPNVLGSVPADFTTITNSSLFDATSSLVTTSSDIDSLAAANGWFITLGAGNGEKVLAPSLTINGEIFFSTYTPPASVTRTDCAPPPGVGRLYRVSLFDATPVVDETGDGAVDDVEDRVDELNRPGIPPAPAAHYHENSDGSVDLILMEGTESKPVPDAIHILPTYWRDDS